MALQTVEQQTEGQQMDHRVVDISRVARTVRGGRRFRFRAAVLVGDKRGTVGFGIAKGADVQMAIKKAQEAAQKRQVSIPIVGASIPHEQRKKFRGSYVILKPAPEGSGVIAGSVVRAVVELAGINDISSKVFGSPNKLNIVQATLAGLSEMKNPKVAGRKKEEQV